MVQRELTKRARGRVFTSAARRNHRLHGAFADLLDEYVTLTEQHAARTQGSSG